MLKLYCILTGEDYSLLSHDTPGSKKKVALLANCLMIPVIMWFINGFLISSEIMRCSLLISSIIATIAALIIFLVERTVIMANSNNWMKAFRVLLGVCVAFLGSIFLDEVIFKNDIDQQLETEKDAELESSIKTIEASFDSQLTEQKTLVRSRYNDWIMALEDAKTEADGSGGSGVRGISGITLMKNNIAQTAGREYKKAAEQQEFLLVKLQNEIDEKVEEISSIDNSKSLLIRIQALFNLVFNDIWMGVVYCLFTLLLFFLEFLVIIVKSNMPETNYERKMKMIDEIGIRKLEKLSNHNFFDPNFYNPSVLTAKQAIKGNHASILRN